MQVYNNTVIVPSVNDIVIPSSTATPIYDGRRVAGAYAVDGEKVTKNIDWTMSKEWAQRPSDERFHTFAALKNAAEHWERISYENPVRVGNIVVTDNMEIIIPDKNGQYTPLDPTHLAFGQLCEAAEQTAPAYYLRQLALTGDPRKIARAAGILRDGLGDRGKDAEISAYVAHDEGERSLRSLVFNEQTRITNADVLRALEPIIGDLTANNSMLWKTPGTLDWGNMQHNPYDMEHQDSLFMGPEDMCLFFCQDANPVEIGKTRAGLPDVYFPGCIVTTSEVKHMAIHIITMMLRSVCCNLSLRGVEGKKSFQIRHTKQASARLLRNAEPVIDSSLEVGRFVAQITAMKRSEISQIRHANNIDDRKEAKVKYLQHIFPGAMCSKTMAEEIIRVGELAEQHPIETVYDAYNAITEYAKGVEIQEKRRLPEYAAMSLLSAAA